MASPLVGNPGVLGGAQHRPSFTGGGAHIREDRGSMYIHTPWARLRSYINAAQGFLPRYIASLSHRQSSTGPWASPIRTYQSHGRARNFGTDSLATVLSAGVEMTGQTKRRRKKKERGKRKEKGDKMITFRGRLARVAILCLGDPQGPRLIPDKKVDPDPQH